MTNKKDYAPIKLGCNGATVDFPFSWKILEEKSILVFLSDKDGAKTILNLGTDYTVKFDDMGGNVKTKKTYPAGNDIILERKASLYQGKTFSTSAGFQASEVEKAFDGVSINLQDMDYNIENFKTTFSESVETEIATNKQDTDKQIADNKTDTDNQISSFEAEVNAKIVQVNEAVQKLNRLDDVLLECEGYATSAEEQSIISQQQAVEAGNSATKAETSLNEIKTEHTQITTEIKDLRTQTLNDIESTKQNAEAEIKRMGIYMVDDRLFYKDSKGVTHEFRNDEGGIAPMPVKHKDIKKIEEGFALTWTEPEDSLYQNNVYCTWGKTVIVRKQGSYPESVYDGDVVVTNTIRNQYAKVPYIDKVNNAIDFKYRAFPCSINKVYSVDENNKFGQWIYSFTRIMKESVPSEKIVYRGTNEHYRKAFMDFSSDSFNYGDWENAPFLLKDRLAPCVVGFDGTVKYFLNPNNYKQKEDGTPSDVTNTNLDINCFMRIKLLYRRKRVNAEGNTEVDISNIKVNSEYKPYGSFIKPDGSLREYIYLPIYRGSLISGKCRSMSGNLTPMSGQTAPNERKYCQANGAGFDMITTSDGELIEDIYMLMFKDMNSQTALGQGKSNGGSDVNACLKSGTMDDKGYFYGSSSNAVGIKFLGMENRYASQWERRLGEVLVNGVRKVKLCQGTSDGSTTADYNFTGEGYIPLEGKITGSSGGYISEEKTYNDIGTFPVVISGSSTTYECDGMWFNNSGTMVVLRGGSSADGSRCGVFCSTLDNPASGAAWALGSSVSFKPL